MDSFAKQPYEQFTITVDFSPRMAADDSLSTIEVGATVASSDEDATSAVVLSSDVDAKTALVTVKAGTSGVDYNLHVRVITANAGRLEHDVLMRVRERKGRLT